MEKVQTKHKFIAYLFYVLIALVLYYQAFYFDYFFFDDRETFQENPSIYNLLNIKDIFLTFKTRFIPGYTFALNYAIGGITHFWFRLTNILIHGLNSFLAYLLAFELLSLAVRKNQIKLPSVQLTSFFVGLIFLVHPIQTEAINLVVQRMTMMSTMFYMLTAYFFICFRTRNLKRYFIAAIMTCVLAMFCKENAFTIPFMLLVIDFLFFADHPGGKKRYVQHIPFLMTLVIIPILLSFTTPQMIHTARIAASPYKHGVQTFQPEGLTTRVDITRANYTGGFPRYRYFLTEINVLRTYMRLFLFPVNQHLLRGYPIVGIFPGPITIFTAFFLIGLVGFAVYLRKKHTVMAFIIFWFFITLSIESSVIPIGQLITEYRMYIAMFGLSFALVYFITINIQNRKLCLILIASLAISWAYATSARNLDWQDENTLWRDNYLKNPKDIRVARSYATMLGSLGQPERALEIYNQVYQLISCDWILCQNMFVTNLQLKRYSDAARVIKIIKKELGESFDYYYLKGSLAALIGDSDVAINYFKKALMYDSSQKKGYEKLCDVYERKQYFKKAITCYGEAIKHADYEFGFYVRKAVLLYYLKNEEGYQKFLEEIRQTKFKHLVSQMDEGVHKYNFLEEE